MVVVDLGRVRYFLSDVNRVLILHSSNLVSDFWEAGSLLEAGRPEGGRWREDPFLDTTNNYFPNFCDIHLEMSDISTRFCFIEKYCTQFIIYVVHM